MIWRSCQFQRSAFTQLVIGVPAPATPRGISMRNTARGSSTPPSPALRTRSFTLRRFIHDLPVSGLRRIRLPERDRGSSALAESTYISSSMSPGAWMSPVGIKVLLLRARIRVKLLPRKEDSCRSAEGKRDRVYAGGMGGRKALQRRSNLNKMQFCGERREERKKQSSDSTDLTRIRNVGWRNHDSRGTGGEAAWMRNVLRMRG